MKNEKRNRKKRNREKEKHKLKGNSKPCNQKNENSHSRREFHRFTIVLYGE